MQFGLGSADLASQLQQQQQYMNQFYNPTPMPGAVDLGDLPWEASNPFVEPTRTRSRFEFANFGQTSKPNQGFSDAWKAPSADQWGFPSNDLGYSNPQDLQQSFRALLPNVNINFASQGLGGAMPSSEQAWGFNQQPNTQAQTPSKSANAQSGQNISINNNINNINININNHHHTPNYPNNYQGFLPVTKEGTTTTTTTSFSFGGNPFAGDSWGFNNQTTPVFSASVPSQDIFLPKEEDPVVEKPKSNTNAPGNAPANKKAKGKKGKKN
jgi:hypothetical protein